MQFKEKSRADHRNVEIVSIAVVLEAVTLRKLSMNREREGRRIELWGPPTSGGQEEEEDPAKAIETEQQVM